MAAPIDFGGCLACDIKFASEEQYQAHIDFKHAADFEDEMEQQNSADSSPASLDEDTKAVERMLDDMVDDGILNKVGDRYNFAEGFDSQHSGPSSPVKTRAEPTEVPDTPARPFFSGVPIKSEFKKALFVKVEPAECIDLTEDDGQEHEGGKWRPISLDSDDESDSETDQEDSRSPLDSRTRWTGLVSAC